MSLRQQAPHDDATSLSLPIPAFIEAQAQQRRNSTVLGKILTNNPMPYSNPTKFSRTRRTRTGSRPKTSQINHRPIYRYHTKHPPPFTGQHRVTHRLIFAVFAAGMEFNGDQIQLRMCDELYQIRMLLEMTLQAQEAQKRAESERKAAGILTQIELNAMVNSRAQLFTGMTL